MRKRQSEFDDHVVAVSHPYLVDLGVDLAVIRRLEEVAARLHDAQAEERPRAHRENAE